MMHLRPADVPYILLGIERVIAETADQLDKGVILGRVGLVARKYTEYLLFLESAETPGRQDVYRLAGARQTD